MYAVGIRNLGDIPLAHRTLYEFRERVLNYTVSHPDQADLLFSKFQPLTNHFLTEAKLSTNEQRVDSTHIMPNIKVAGRLSIAYDVLRQAISDCPLEILPQDIQDVLKPEYNTETKTWVAKPNKDIQATSLQSAYDPDATFRNKAGKIHSGYVLNLAETCNDDNPVQLITDYSLEDNGAYDAHILHKRLTVMKELNPELKDVYVDGAYM